MSDQTYYYDNLIYDTNNFAVNGSAVFSGPTTFSGQTAIDSLVIPAGNTLTLPNTTTPPLVPMTLSNSAAFHQAACNASGAITVANYAQVAVQRLNGIIFLDISPNFGAEALAAAPAIILAGAIPAGYRTPSTYRTACNFTYLDNATVSLGEVVVYATGDIQLIPAAGGNFTAGHTFTLLQDISTRYFAA